MYVKSVRNLYLSTYLHKRQNIHACCTISFLTECYMLIYASVNKFENKNKTFLKLGKDLYFYLQKLIISNSGIQDGRFIVKVSYLPH